MGSWAQGRTPSQSGSRVGLAIGRHTPLSGSPLGPRPRQPFPARPLVRASSPCSGGEHTAWTDRHYGFAAGPTSTPCAHPWPGGRKPVGWGFECKRELPDSSITQQQHANLPSYTTSLRRSTTIFRRQTTITRRYISYVVNYSLAN